MDDAGGEQFSETNTVSEHSESVCEIRSLSFTFRSRHVTYLFFSSVSERIPDLSGSGYCLHNLTVLAASGCSIPKGTVPIDSRISVTLEGRSICHDSGSQKNTLYFQVRSVICYTRLVARM